MTEPEQFTDPYGGQILEIAPPSKKRRGVVIGTVSALVVLVGAGGVYLTTQLAGGGLQPEALAPASTFAFAKIDLDPAANQKLAAKNLAERFPGAPKAAADDIFRSFVAEALEAEGELDYATDVEPWLGKRIGIAGFTDSAGSPRVIGILQSKDDAQARAALDRMAAKSHEYGGPTSYAISRGYAVVGDDPAAVNQAVTESAKSSLADVAQFGDDVDRLTGDQVAIGWVDLGKVLGAVRREFPDVGLIPNALAAQFDGRVVVGAHASNTYVEVEGLAIGVPATQGLVAGRQHLLTGLPGSTVAAVSVNDLGKQLGTSLSAFGGFGVNEMIAGLEEQTGLSLKDDLLPLLGKQTVLALGSSPVDFTQAKLGLLAQVGDAASAREVGKKLVTLAGQAGVPLASDVKGDTFYLAFGSGYLGQLQSGQGLGERPAFRQAMGDLADDVAAAAFVDIGAIVDSLPVEFVGAELADLKALSAFGASTWRQGDTQHFRARLVVR